MTRTLRRTTTWLAMLVVALASSGREACAQSDGFPRHPGSTTVTNPFVKSASSPGVVDRLPRVGIFSTVDRLPSTSWPDKSLVELDKVGVESWPPMAASARHPARQGPAVPYIPASVFIPEQLPQVNHPVRDAIQLPPITPAQLGWAVPQPVQQQLPRGRSFHPGLSHQLVSQTAQPQTPTVMAPTHSSYQRFRLPNASLADYIPHASTLPTVNQEKPADEHGLAGRTTSASLGTTPLSNRPFGMAVVPTHPAPTNRRNW